jgi:hypothetical protein
MNVIENSTLIEVGGGFSEQPSPFPMPAADLRLVDTWEIVICLDFTVYSAYTMIHPSIDLNTAPVS